MARKSRKHLVDIAVSPEHTPERVYYNAAAYERLSADDKKKRGDSLETQRKIIENFVAVQPNIRIVETYIDNDLTGRNFDRPGFQKMLADIECGKINCIIVKDLTRFGRNTIDAGYYLEKYFPAHGVRFISVTDPYDSLDGDGGIMIPLKNLISESYALDISRKCRAVHQQNIASGRFVGRVAPYGFKKAPEDCRKLIPDPDTAPTVQQMFDWAAIGTGVGEIARRLNAQGIPSPSHHNFARGFNTSKKSLGTIHWRDQTIGKILADRVYVGDMVQGKTRTVDGKTISNDPSEWVCVPNTHEPIVNHGVFSRVQMIRQNVCNKMKKSRENSVPYTTNIFPSKVFCGKCGHLMERKRNTKGGAYWFRCESKLKFGKEVCTVVSVREIDLKVEIMTILHKQSEAILGRYISLERTSFDKDDAELHKINQGLDRDGRLLRSLYENMVNDLITQAEFVQMKATYEAKIEVLSNRADEIRNRRYEAKVHLAECYNIADATSETLADDKLTAALMDRLIQEIRVHPNKSFEILFRFRDEFGEGSRVG